jgi:hypothetical protein
VCMSVAALECFINKSRASSSYYLIISRHATDQSEREPVEQMRDMQCISSCSPVRRILPYSTVATLSGWYIQTTLHHTTLQ